MEKALTWFLKTYLALSPFLKRGIDMCIDICVEGKYEA